MDKKETRHFREPIALSIFTHLEMGTTNLQILKNGFVARHGRGCGRMECTYSYSFGLEEGLSVTFLHVFAFPCFVFCFEKRRGEEEITVEVEVSLAPCLVQGRSMHRRPLRL